MNKKKGLGRGLSALLSDLEPEQPVSPELEATRRAAATVALVSLDQIDPSPSQPRTQFPEESLRELADSMRELGVIQPLTLRKKEDGRYEIISGERRFRAARLAGLTEVPAYVRAAGDSEALEMALVENIQREDLNPLDVAISLKRLTEEFNLTQDQLSQRIGKPRSTLANFMRLLKLPPEIQHGLRENKITMGHARALINMPDPEKQIRLYRRVVKEELSVRQVEELVRRLGRKDLETHSGHGTEHQPRSYYPEYLEKLTDFFGTNVEIRTLRNGISKVIVTFNSEADMLAFLDRMPQV
ncbi:MAG: ParB/RepB/Spo0J family partition protein [Flavobacteriales bacterium]|nr:ParB/RepB/Spo0J family partition protein [Flavobacteriales bacterium]MCX7767948.1 ParB/RepB/Spo0J family partition protein [Flavobacteriales bacterium]MDW8410811.1 ParB/RepB/Spo0J family partition protein [Flavobacteriales bacterium]